MTSLPTIDALNQLIFVEDEPQAADMAFVLGSEWLPTMDRVIQLYTAGLVPRIFIAGGSYLGRPRDKSEAEAFRDYAVERGIPNDAIIVETSSRNTLENLKFARPLIADQIGWEQISTIIFVCQAFHARRVLMTAARHWPRGVRYLCIPVVDGRRIQRTNWWLSASRRARVFQELKRIAAYALKLDISEV